MVDPRRVLTFREVARLGWALEGGEERPLPILSAFRRFVSLDHDRHTAYVESATPLDPLMRDEIRVDLLRQLQPPSTEHCGVTSARKVSDASAVATVPVGPPTTVGVGGGVVSTVHAC